MHIARGGFTGSAPGGHDGDLLDGGMELHSRILLGHCHTSDGRVW